MQYEGYQATYRLWEGELVGLTQLNIQEAHLSKFDISNDIPKLRLGHLVERFVSNELENNVDIQILAQNVQIKKDKITIGELDCILNHNNVPIHLEIIYKFYLYDETVGNSELEHWIGPNRSDSLIKKITKLKNKQLPLIHKPETKPLLTKLNLDANNIQQQVYFKAQLFVPYTMLNMPLRMVNNNCIKGYYIHFDDLNRLEDCLFYIPSKLDWLTEVQQNVSWMSYHQSSQLIEESITQQRAPLCWLKAKDESLQKIFVVWW